MGTKLQPLVSICMPAFNVEKVLGSAINSVLAQTYPNIEIILVDDASTDGTFNVANAIVDKRVQYIRNKNNMGGYQTMNKAVSLSKGEIVAIYHADDIYEPTIVEKEVAYLQSHPHVGAVFCLAHFMDFEGNVFGGYSLPREFRGRESHKYEDIFPFLLRNKNILFCCPTFMTRREVLNTVGLFDAKRYDIAADLDMWIRISRRYPIGILEEWLIKYRVGKNQWTARHNYLRTKQELCFTIMDFYIKKDCWSKKLSNRDIVEYSFHRCDDETFRAVNLIILENITEALELLKRPYPWKTLTSNIKRRKFRVLLLRLLMQVGLIIGFSHILTIFLKWIEYGDRNVKYK